METRGGAAPQARQGGRGRQRRGHALGIRAWGEAATADGQNL
jgi:hypothetical protein